MAFRAREADGTAETSSSWTARSRGGPHGELYLGELDGEVRARTSEIEKVFAAADIKVSVERDMDGWLKYHFAFIAPTTGVIFKKGGDLRAVAADRESIHQYCRACREAGDVLRKVGYRKRQPPVFNLYYWLPRWLEPPVFSKLFNSRSAEVRFGLHAPGVVPELLEMAEEFAELKAEAGMETPTLDSLLACLPRPAAASPPGEGLVKRILVAGSTGYLGGFVCRELKARGHFVRALARSPEKLAPLRDSLDEIVEAEVTRPETLEHVCDGIDVVFSSVGITRQKDGLTFRDVDYQGNKNLLDVALRAGVQKFVYVSAVNGTRLRHLDIVDAHEAFVEELEASGLDHTVVRPTGYFSDMSEVFEMARKGRVWLIGSGTNRVNPIHGADLAVVCADAIESARQTEIAVGGPQTMTWREVAKLAFEVLGRPAKVTCIPEWLMWPVVRLVRLFNRHQGELLAFFTTMATTDVVAPPTGTRTLEQHFKGGTGMKVEDLSQFGKPLGMPKKAQRKKLGRRVL